MPRKPKQLHIAIIIDDFYPSSGGISRSVENQINAFIHLGHNVTLIAPRHNLRAPDQCSLIIAPSFYIPSTPSHMCVIHHSKRFARNISSKHRFDIVHSQTDRGALILAANIASLQNIPHVHTFHANLAGTHSSQPLMSFWGSMAYLCLIIPSLALSSRHRSIPKNKIIRPKKSVADAWIERIDWRSLATISTLVDAYVTPSYFMKDYIERFLQHDGRGHTIPNGMDDNRLQSLEEAVSKKQQPHTANLRFLSIGRLSKEKRVDAIIEAFIHADIPGSELHIVGSGDQLPRLRSLANKSNKNIKFSPHLTDAKKISQAYLDSDVFVLASYHFDNQPMTIVEATAAGLPIVFCDERLDVGLTPKNSIRAASPDPLDIAAAMQEIAPIQRRTVLSRGSLQLSKELKASSMATGYLTLYNRLINELIED